jgi:hypothetical protein
MSATHERELLKALRKRWPALDAEAARDRLEHYRMAHFGHPAFTLADIERWQRHRRLTNPKEVKNLKFVISWALGRPNFDADRIAGQFGIDPAYVEAIKDGREHAKDPGLLGRTGPCVPANIDDALAHLDHWIAEAEAEDEANL